MKLSCHTIVVEDYPKDGEHLFYNTRTQALVKVDKTLKGILDNIETIGFESDLFEKHKLELSNLYKMGILVKDDKEDALRLKNYLSQLKFGVNPKLFTVNILTTYACNFKCTYCFEETSRTMEKLNLTTQEQVILWLKRRIERLGYRQLYINFYGGEPLLNQQAIDNISTYMKGWCKNQNINFFMSIQTNGYLMTPELIKRYLKLGLHSIRISLDGVGEDNDRYRILRGGGGTFDRIVKNIEDCADLVPIGISIGYDKGNVEPIEKLLNYFDDKGILDKLGKFIFSPLHPTLGPTGSPEMVQNQTCMCNANDNTMVEATRKINQLLESKGIPTGKGMSNATCPVTRENGGVTIDQHGRLYKCNSMLGHPELAVGDIKNDQFNEQGGSFRDLDVWRQCPQDCTYLPMCSGGCRLMSFLENKNFHVPSCKKPYLNKMAAELIKRDYEKLQEEKLEKSTV